MTQPKSNPAILTPAYLTPAASACVAVQTRTILVKRVFENIFCVGMDLQRKNVVVSASQGAPQKTISTANKRATGKGKDRRSPGYTQTTSERLTEVIIMGGGRGLYMSWVKEAYGGDETSHLDACHGL